MSVLDLNGVADPVERKRFIKQAEQETGNAGIWKALPIIIVCAIASGLVRDFNWASPLWPGTEFSTQFYEWIVSFFIFGAGTTMAYRLRRSERQAAMAEILRCARRCTGCGYPIEESPDAVCPECGIVRGHR